MCNQKPAPRAQPSFPACFSERTENKFKKKKKKDSTSPGCGGLGRYGLPGVGFFLFFYFLFLKKISYPRISAGLRLLSGPGLL
jgi:hypothetical protein